MIRCTYALFFSVFIAVIWEIGEFTSFYNTGQDIQHSLVIWVVDQNAVDRVVNSYTGEKVKVVYKDASYSMRELKSIIIRLPRKSS